MRSDRVRRDSQDLERWCEIYVSGRTLDGGGYESAPSLASQLRAFRAADAEYFGAWLNQQLVGVASVRASNPAESFTRIYVEPSARRMGAGRTLADQVLSWSSDRGCHCVKSIVLADSAGERFAVALGSEIELHLVTVVRDLHETLFAVPMPTGVRLQRWRDGTPEELLDAYAVLRRTVGDAPDAALQMNASARDAAWIRTWEATRTATGDQLWVCAAVAQGSGELVAFTEAQVPTAGDAQQHDTAVLPDWRGRGMARWLKTDMLSWLREERPGVKTLSSTINKRNTPMLRVSAKVGFRETWHRKLVAMRV